MPSAKLQPQSPPILYCGRLAPTPTGHLHLGHARTFWVAWRRARDAGGLLFYRDEDLDPHRCRPEFARGAETDLRWLGLDWDAGPDRPGPHSPYRQSLRHARGDYLAAWARLRDLGLIYPCARSRRDVASAILAPHEDGEPAEPLFPSAFRPPEGTGRDCPEPGAVNWRFRVPDGEGIRFLDRVHGPQERLAGIDFGDFLIWRKDGFPAYELAVVVDDLAMGITEIVRGADLLTSTARQLLLYRALQAPPPAFFHCPLVCGPDGRRLAKRHHATALATLRARGHRPEDITAPFPADLASWLCP